jgi:Mn-dependent DtxR family transcriptional regulator
MFDEFDPERLIGCGKLDMHSVFGEAEPMMNATQQEVLRTLFDLARADRPADLALVAASVGLSCARADEVLEELEQEGLVDGERVRLTMAGLVVAVSAVRGRRRGARGRRRAASRAA